MIRLAWQMRDFGKGFPNHECFIVLEEFVEDVV